jgi:hypothetical protein
MPGQHHHSLIHPVDAHAVRQPDHKLKVRHPPEKLHVLNPLPREKQKPIRVESVGIYNSFLEIFNEEVQKLLGGKSGKKRRKGKYNRKHPAVIFSFAF